jgi:glutathione synthase/RimK-type ligase-like ATP-grasp enzyme
MVNILIPTKPDDQHALLIKFGLEKKSHQATLWYTADFPALQMHSFEVKDRKVLWHARGFEFAIDPANKFDTVWFRRPRSPVLPQSVHPEDITNANHENMELFKTFWRVIAPEARWVNPTDASRKVNCKLLQLKVAAEVGLSIPETLISNNPAKIKDFIGLHGGRTSIYKTFFPVSWIEEKELRLCYTQEINLVQLPADSILQMTPGIFQKKINKAFELRVNIFGDTCITAKLHSQEHPKGIMDWRFVPGHELRIKEFILPDEIFQQCKALMKKFGIVFGCFDFIVTPEGEYYFLEVNEQGQFLWIEDINPDIRIFDAFIDFLISGDNNFKWEKSKSSLRLNDFVNDMILAKEHAMRVHQAPATIY